MKESDSHFERFLAGARKGKPARGAEEPPFGFSTRVVARWLARREDPLVPWEKFARWGAAVALGVALFFAAVARPHTRVNPLAALAVDAQPAQDAW